MYFDWVVFGSLAEKFIENTAGPVYLEKKTVNCNKTEMGCVNLIFEYFYESIVRIRVVYVIFCVQSRHCVLYRPRTMDAL